MEAKANGKSRQLVAAILMSFATCGMPAVTEGNTDLFSLMTPTAFVLVAVLNWLFYFECRNAENVIALLNHIETVGETNQES